jgi:hypothetical protein
MSDSNSQKIMLIVIAALVLGAAVFLVIRMNKKKSESFTANYLENVAVGNMPAQNGIFAMPSFPAALDPRFENQGVSSLRGGPGAPPQMMPFPTSGGSMYSEEDMISMGGCAKVCGEGNYCKKMNCPFGQEYPKWATGSEEMSVNPDILMKSSGMGNGKSGGNGDRMAKAVKDNKIMNTGMPAGDLTDFKQFENKIGRFSVYQNEVKAEEMLPKPDIAANVDPSQYVVYDRNMGSMMMKSGNRTPVDFIRGDVIPVTKNCTPTISARIGDPDSPMFVPRFGSDIGTLQRGYFTNYNDVVQVLEERNSAYFMSKGEALRNELKKDAGMM